MKKVDVALPAQAKLGECPRWDEREQVLYWIDIDSFQLHRFDPKTGEDTFLQFEEEVGCFSLRENHDGFVLAMRSGFYFLDGWSTALRAISDPESDLAKNRFNDGRCDAAGRFLAGSYYPPKDINGANLWSLGSDLRVEKLVDGLLTYNGTAFSPDNKMLYFSDTPKHAIYRYDYDLASGQIANGATFYQFEFGNGRPDGGAVDSEGFYWTALYEGARIARISPSGELVDEFAVPAKCPTMVAFGGEDLQTLYITTVGSRPAEELEQYPDSGAIFKVRVGVPGLKENRFSL